MRNYEEFSVVKQLNEKNDLRVDFNRRRIEILTGSKSKGDVGIKSKGKIDFLMYTVGYYMTTVDKFDN